MSEEEDKKLVDAAYRAGFYIDRDGKRWRRGMDGWFMDNVDGKGGVMLVRDHDMETLILREANR